MLKAKIISLYFYIVWLNSAREHKNIIFFIKRDVYQMGRLHTAKYLTQKSQHEFAKLHESN